MTTEATTAAPADTSAPPAAPAATPSPLPVEPAPSRARGRSKEAPAAEAAPPAEPPKSERPKADEWAKLTAAEKRQRKERETLNAERRAFGEERKAIEAQKERIALIDRAKAGDWEAREKLLAETGLTYDQWTKRALAAGKVDKGETALERIDRLEKDLRERDARAEQEAEKLTFSQTVDTFVQHVTKESPDAYPILSGEIEADRPRVEQVIREMMAASRESNTPITYAEAASKFEAYLRAETDRRVARLRPALPPTPPPAAEAAKTSTETRPRDETGRFAGGDGPRRLTNRDSAERSAAPSASSPSRRLTSRERDAEERERLRRAAAVMPRRSA